MQKVTIRFKNYPAVIERVLGSVLTLQESKTMRGLRDGFSYTTDASPMLVIASFEAEGILFSEFESIAFYPG